ncbi:primosomal protein N' [Lentimicrobium sp.]
MPEKEYTAWFVDLLLPLPLYGYFTYRVPQELNEAVKPGLRAVVQFGAKKFYTGLIRRVHTTPPKQSSIKYILDLVDDFPVVNENQFIFWKWMADYYLCSEGEVMNAALPSAYKLASETRIKLDPEYIHDTQVLNEREFLIVEALGLHKVLTLTEVGRIVDLRKVIPLIKTLIDKGIIRVEEELSEKYKPRYEKYIRLGAAFQNEENLHKAIDLLHKRAYRQMEMLMYFIQIASPFSGEGREVSRNNLLSGPLTTAATLDALLKKGILEQYQQQISRLTHLQATTSPSSIELTPAQQHAFNQILPTLDEAKVTLLKGVTSSGKTELYIRLIDEVIKQGKQVLYLLPEIALTTQIIVRLQKCFGDDVGVYHSKHNEFERIEIWNKANAPLSLHRDEQSYKILLGPRSALFLPFNTLGLIIVDEEHDTSYKQHDPAPRYNGRDTALMLGRLHKAAVILGSATPAVESYYHARGGKYNLVEINERYGGVKMPDIQIIDTRNEIRLKRMKSHFAAPLFEAIGTALEAKEQIILFQNRRGFSLRLECQVCHHIPGCVNCDVTLTYHKNINLLKCHYCGYTMPVPPVCPECNSPSILMRGFGTEKVEEELGILFPETTIARMDLDTTRTKNAYQSLIGDFEIGKINILVGTQMVTKGLNFENVSLVGVLSADGMMSYPDFRALERSYQLLAQVSGRSGRKAKQGVVMIQTNNPEHPLLQWVKNDDYLKLFENQLLDRYKYNYPPYTRLLRISLRHKSQMVLDEAANTFAGMLRKQFGKALLGPEYPMVNRIKNYYIKNMLLKMNRGAETGRMKQALQQITQDFTGGTNFKTVKIIIDVDPA